MNWPFELPEDPSEGWRDSYSTGELLSYADDCVAAALRWAAEQCVPGSSDYGSAKMALIDRRDRILAALPKAKESS